MLICCGESLIDMIPAPTTDGAEGFVPHCGGAVFNTAIALGRLGAQSAMISGISNDLFGARLARALESSQVSTAALIRSDRPTTLAFVTLIDGKASYMFYDEQTAGRMIAPEDLPRDLPRGTRALFFGGISLAVEPCAETYAALCNQTARDHVVMIDPNIRPGFIRDTARFRARLDGMMALADIVKLSDEDLDWLCPGDAPLVEKAERIRALGARIVIITRGGDGAMACFGTQETVEARARKVSVVDTVGAGDTFNAGVLYRLDRLGLLDKTALKNITAPQLADALEFGARVAAVTVSRAGANPPWQDELDS